MVTTNTSGLSGPMRKESLWRRKWSRNERLFVTALIVLIVALVWVGWNAPVPVTTKPTTTVTKSMSTTVTRAASGPATVPTGNTVTTSTTQTVTTKPSPAPAIVVLPLPAAPKAQASAPKTATKVEQKSADRKAAKAETPQQQTKIAQSQRKDAHASILSAAQTGKPFAWTHVGGDPCNPKVGCTLAWALEQSKWPADVQTAFITKVRGESPEAYVMKTGWQGWMTWGQYERKFRSNTLAAWPSGHKEPADLWSVNYGSTSYHLIRVAKCKNWGGFTTPGPAPMHPAQPASPGMMPLGIIPTVACPD